MLRKPALRLMLSQSDSHPEALQQVPALELPVLQEGREGEADSPPASRPEGEREQRAAGGVASLHRPAL